MSTHSTTFASAPKPVERSSVRQGPVLIAVGGHDAATTVRAGSLIAEYLERDMRVLTVIEPLPADCWDRDGDQAGGTFFEERAAAARHELARVIAPRGREMNWPVEVLAGKVPDILARITHERHVSLLVMGIGRRRPINRLLGAETVLRTVRHSVCPVLAVYHTFSGAPTTAAVGVDFSRTSAFAARSVAALLAPSATLHLVHVWQPSSVDDEEATRENDSYRLHLPERFRRFIHALDLPSTLEVQTEIREGRPAERLVDFANAHQIGLIAIGRNGRRIVERLLIGGVAERVLRSAACSVLIAPDAPFPEFPLAAAPDGASEDVLARGTWATELDAIARRYAGHVVALEVHDPAQHTVSRERGYLLFGISHDVQTGLVSIVLGETNGRRQHRTRQIVGAERIAVTRDAHGEVLALRIQHGAGESLLSVIPLVPRDDAASDE